MRQNVLYGSGGMELFQRIGNNSIRFPRRAVVAVILLIALFAFEIFNFDTTRYALTNLLGPVSFASVGWASILAVAFCAIDFAGLVRMFTPEVDGEQPKEVWYLMGAWLLGATMNAVMTWWAVSLTLLSHDFGNEVLSRGQLLQIVPIFVATLVWLTRILFIGALTATGSQLIHGEAEDVHGAAMHGHRPSLAMGMPLTENGARTSILQARNEQPTLVSHHGLSSVSDELPAFLKRRAGYTEAESDSAAHYQPERQAPARQTPMAMDFDYGPDEEAPPAPREPRIPRNVANNSPSNGRVRQRPPMPGANGFHARSRSSN